MPEAPSWHVNRAVTGPLFQPCAFEWGLSATEIVGGVRSMPNALLVTDAVLPAMSIAVPLTVWFAPSVAIT
jgi:hypothetical protein